MEFRVVLDSSVVLAACLDPAMDPKSALAAQVLATLREEELAPAVTESIHAEVETKLRDRIGQILHALRALSSQPPPLSPGHTAEEMIERLFTRLKRELRESRGGLQLLESRLTSLLTNVSIPTEAAWMAILQRVALTATEMHAEVQRRHDALNLEVLPRVGKADHDRFRPFVPTSDLEHVAVLAAFAQSKRTRVLFHNDGCALARSLRADSQRGA